MTERAFGLLVVSAMLLSMLGVQCGDKEEPLAGTGGSGGEPATMTASSSGGSGGPASVCVDGQFSCDGQELLLCAGGQSFHFKTCDTTETCDGAIADCSCVLDTKRCSGDSIAQVCVMGTGGANEYESTSCKFPEKCVDGACTTNIPPCINGEFKCASDGDTVEHCEPDGNGNLLWVPKLKCSVEGFENHCQFITGVTEATTLCMNACNVRGAPLTETLCSPAGDPVCAVRTCTAKGTSLVPDHTDCRAGGQPCVSNEQCLSCTCQNALCVSNFPKKCGIAEIICP